ncbi:MAG: hypothetical protein Q8K96_00345 [Rubrivivax sp.]|nr:hypothetical protein [Rubrivivax sp.]
MTSPLVTRLLSGIEGCYDKEERYSLLAELACYRARIGEFEEAEDLRIELRREFGDGRSIRVSILIMCAESLLHYFRELSEEARDRMARANLLSNAARDDRLIALTSSWLAHIDFNLNRFEAMEGDVRACFQSIHADDGTAECRVSIVLGDAFLFVGNTVVSQAWYERARRAATRIGDQAAVGAITYNRAALRVAASRLACVTAPVDEDMVRLVHLEVQSAINYQAVAQLKSLEHLLQTAKIGVLILQEKFAEAETECSELLSGTNVPKGSSQWLLLQADLSLALAQIGRLDEAKRRFRPIGETEVLSRSADDRALIFSSIARAAQLCGEVGLAERCAALSVEAVREHEERIKEVRRRVQSFEQGPPTQ